MRKLGSLLVSGLKWLLMALVVIAVAVPLLLFAMRDPQPAFSHDGGVAVARMSTVRKFVSAESVEASALGEYREMIEAARNNATLLGPDQATAVRIKGIAQKLLASADRFNARAKAWTWEINAIRSATVNAYCMPGGKIVVYTGLIDGLALTDGELAFVLGHEIAHALREHSRGDVAKERLTGFGVKVMAVIMGDAAEQVARAGGALLGLKHSRSDEAEADLVGMELAVRAGYDPADGVALWQKMAAAAGGGAGSPPLWMSTHPADASRIDLLKRHFKDVLPIYERAKANKV